MDEMKGNEGVNRLARALQWRMHIVGDKPPIMDFGEIQGDISLLTNYFPLPIPQKDYMVCRSATTILQPGDRVLVAWAGDDACVIDLILPATVIT